MNKKQFFKSGAIGAIVGFIIFTLLLILGNLNFGYYYLIVTDHIFDFFVLLLYPFGLLNICNELECIFYMPFFAAIEGFIIGLITFEVRFKLNK
ncbi:hypothetical protein C4566_03540 [Candidatus Parcubacteria bacterium]|nr:MAG: hypothetical protein C4566_03540 [Candidatus Parcubacteria bacterium]